MLADLIVYLSFLLTPLGGVVGFHLLLRTGWFTDDTVERTVPFFAMTPEYYTFKSHYHRLTSFLIGFFGMWILTLVLYIYVLNSVYF